MNRETCAKADELREALRDMTNWFRKSPEKDAFSAAEHLLPGCPNNLLASIERARKLSWRGA